MTITFVVDMINSPENETLTGLDKLATIADSLEKVSVFSSPRLNTVLALPCEAGPDCHRPGQEVTEGPGFITPSQ